MKNHLSTVRNWSKTDGLFLIGLISSLSITLIVYWPGINGPFVFDDIPNLSELGKFQGVDNLYTFQHFVFGNISGPTGRPVAMLSFLLNSSEWPTSAQPFKFTNIIIHLLCGLAICWFVYLLCQVLEKSKTASLQIASVVMTVWLIHPLNVSTTLYVVQRMTQLMLLFGILSLIFYLLGRRTLEVNPKKAILFLGLSLFPFALLSVLSKESGALLLVLIVIKESLFFSNHNTTWQFRLWFRFGIIFPLLIVIGYLVITAPETLAYYEFRNFSLGERLLTEIRILSELMLKILLPDQNLGSVFHDNYPISESFLRPISTLFSGIFLLGLIATAVYFRRTQPVVSFGIYWFFALHLLESTYIPLELYFEHRNYMAMIGPLFVVIWYVKRLLESEASKPLKYVVQIFVIAIVSLSLWLTSQLAVIWGDSMSLYAHMANQNPSSSRAQLSYAEILEREGNLQQTLDQLLLNNQYHSDDLISLLAIWNFACRHQLTEPLSLSEIADVEDLGLVSENVSIYMDQLIGYAQTDACQQVDTNALISLFDRIGDFSIRDVHKSNYYYSFSNLYLLMQQPDSALAMLDRAGEVNETVDLRNWQALVAAGAGQWERSLNYVQRAKEVDERRSALVPSRIIDIQQLELLINARRSSNVDLQNSSQND